MAIGFLVGRLKFGNFSLGIVVGCLLAGVLVGQLNIQVAPLLKTVFFDLFLFTTGYKVGPQFFRGLKRDALPQVTLTVVLCVACLLISFSFSKLLGYDVGTAAGLLAGAFSESTVIGTAGQAIQRLAIGDTEKLALINNIPVAYAVTYLVGTAVLVWYIPKIGPKLMGSTCGKRPPSSAAKVGRKGRGWRRGSVGWPHVRHQGLSRRQFEDDRPDYCRDRGDAEGDPGLHSPCPPGQPRCRFVSRSNYWEGRCGGCCGKVRGARRAGGRDRSRGQ